MSTREVTCAIVVCDGCQKDFHNGEFVPHHDSAIDAREETVNCDWRTDGEHDWCESCQRTAHDCSPDPEDNQSCARCGAILSEDES